MEGTSMIAADEAQVKQAVEAVLDAAKKAGADGAEAGASRDGGLSINVRKGEVETLEHHRGQSLSITVYRGARKGSASSADLSAQAIQDAVKAAMSIATYTSEDECSGLADAELMATDLTDLDLYHPWDISAEGGIEIAQNCEAAALAVDERITNTEGASVNAFQGVSAYANSHGFVGTRRGTRHSVSCSVIAEDDSGMQRDYYYTTSRLPEKLDDVTEVGKQAAERALRRLSAKKLSTRQSPVLFTPELSRGLLGSFIGAISGGAVYRKSTFLLDHMDKQVFPGFVRIHENPHIPQGMGSSMFDSEGVATCKRDYVTDGILNSWVLGSYSARKLGLQTTGNSGGVHNLFTSPGDKDLDELIKTMGTGLLVTELIGHGVNPVTGDYSRGAAGYWVENGELQYPVEEVTIAGNLKNMFMNLAEIGTDIDARGNYQTGSLLIDGLTIAGE